MIDISIIPVLYFQDGVVKVSFIYNNNEFVADELNEEAYFYELDGEDEDMYCQSVPQDYESEIYYDLFDGIEEEGRSECVLAASLDSSTAAVSAKLTCIRISTIINLAVQLCACKCIILLLK